MLELGVLGLLVASSTLGAFTYRTQVPVIRACMCRWHFRELATALIALPVVAMVLIAAGIPLDGDAAAVGTGVACFAAAVGLSVLAWTRVPVEVRGGAPVFAKRIATPTAATVVAIVTVAYLVDPGLWV